MGFRLLRSGGDVHPKMVSRVVDPAHIQTIAIGDAYTLDSSAQISDRANGSDPVHGIVVGFELEALDASPAGPESKDFLGALVGGKVLGCEDPQAEFEVQADTFAAANSISNADLLDAAGDSGLRQSRQQIDNTTYGAGTQFQVLGLIDRPDNAAGAFAKIRVRLLQTL
jgi:hypothetical protein